MNLFSWLRPAAPMLPQASQRRLENLSPPSPLDERSLREQRWVVVDLETTGLNLNKDQVLSIGAVVIEDGAIDFSQQFERTLQCEKQKLGPSVLIHGLAPSTIAAGSEPAEALLAFMEFVGDSPLLAFHAPFDAHMLGRALKDHLGYRLQHTFLDVADLAPMLCPQAALRKAGLDDWITAFKLQVADRHNASADALATAELALILFSRARQQQIHSPLDLQQCLGQWKRRRQAPSI
ncbi:MULTISPECIES: PolC-type DNA polymerase III [unclassified Pseudomonas]|uniref:3'-5' exonuclease n=1 Tax=unclassified Pseudomonas TaxID=196821 RepID=UPI00119B0756|nr:MULTISPECIES: 3'-5' exonuclease [unclassified Pseudomonas]TWC16429.1 DNA polymerase-3 subunit epsilon [Pseudomonas sp. SJZ074]TWC18056.1 DNA polymerase-3 subunit epsilon [Pseudomonas sp. SJZ075]TWC34332.1 DNA polymerase-3 subunit epsilon [Pseudomonas sp. SJZ078]TWC34490.1 DNA polymerase-3 subunit epsilon [Pseudomonas sp. SJZ085]TWC55221.1 DNA polymerase-3 subunit epsilon [Pseudomonas sp. SJZ124]